MIELIHKYPVLIKILLTVVTVSFILTGGWILGKESTSDYAAKVNGEKIPMQTYDAAVNRMDDFYKKIYQGNMPEDVLKKLDIGKKALDALVEREIILQEAGKQGITVTDSELSDAIRDNQSFAGPDGSFDKSTYIKVLQLNGLTPAMYEKSLRNDLIAEKFRKMVKDAAYVSENDVREAYKKQLAMQKKDFDEKDFQAQKENLWRMQTMAAQEQLMNSFMDGVKKSYKVEVNSQIAAKS